MSGTGRPRLRRVGALLPSRSLSASRPAAGPRWASRRRAPSTCRSCRSTTTTGTCSPRPARTATSSPPPAAGRRAGGRRRVPDHPPAQLRAGAPELAHRRRRRPDRRLAVPVRPVQGRAERRVAEHPRAWTSRSVGNHEFDEGVPELLRMQYGGCHPVEGCFDADGYSGADFRWLAANVAYKDGVTRRRSPRAPRYGCWFKSRPTGRTVLPPTCVKTVRRHQGRLHRHDARGHAGAGRPGRHPGRGLRATRSRPPTSPPRTCAASRACRPSSSCCTRAACRRPASTFDYACNDGRRSAALSGPIVDIAQNLDPGIDLVVTGHTHQPYTCNIPDPAGRDRWVTSAVVLRPRGHRDRT